MTRRQRYRYEMFVRVRDFGRASQDLFPASSTGGQTFGRVIAAVAAIEDHLTKRDLARVEARRVKVTTRAAVHESMKAIAYTARQATKDETIPNPFVMPARQSAQALLSKARLFIDEARPREAKFVALGLPATFVSDFASLVDELTLAVTVQNSGRARRERAQKGVEHALDEGFDAIKLLDVIVSNVLKGDPVRLGHWRGARRIEGLHWSRGPKPVQVPEPVAFVAPVPLIDEVLPNAS